MKPCSTVDQSWHGEREWKNKVKDTEKKAKKRKEEKKRNFQVLAWSSMRMPAMPACAYPCTVRFTFIAFP
jgi:hypothetical protein